MHIHLCVFLRISPQFRFTRLYMDTRYGSVLCNIIRNKRIKQHFCSNYYFGFRRIILTAMNIKSWKRAEGYSVTFKKRWSSLEKSSKTVLLSPWVLRNTNQIFLTRINAIRGNTRIIPSFRYETLIAQATNSLINNICNTCDITYSRLPFSVQTNNHIESKLFNNKL